MQAEAENAVSIDEIGKVFPVKPSEATGIKVPAKTKWMVGCQPQAVIVEGDPAKCGRVLCGSNTRAGCIGVEIDCGSYCADRADVKQRRQSPLAKLHESFTCEDCQQCRSRAIGQKGNEDQEEAAIVE